MLGANRKTSSPGENAAGVVGDSSLLVHYGEYWNGLVILITQAV